MQFLVVVQVKQEFADSPPADMKDVLSTEQEQGRRLYGSGDLRQSWEIDGGRPGVVCLYEAESEDALNSILESYLMIQKGYAEVLSIALKPDGAYFAFTTEAA